MAKAALSRSARAHALRLATLGLLIVHV